MLQDPPTQKAIISTLQALLSQDEVTLSSITAGTKFSAQTKTPTFSETV